jgi:predicted DNA-binding antitoxin AbrB/MazE fold protein
MTKTFQALYENGVFRPLGPVDLQEHSRVTVTVHVNGSEPNPLEVLDDLIEWESASACTGNDEVPSLEEVRRMLSTIPGSMADSIIAQREDRV